MKIKPPKIESLIEELQLLQKEMHLQARKQQGQLDAVCDTYRESARNLLYYQAFRDGCAAGWFIPSDF